MCEDFLKSSHLAEPVPRLLVPMAQDDKTHPVSYPREFFENHQADLSNFWILRRNQNIERLLRKYEKSSILEIGSGHGAVARFLALKGFVVRCVEPQIEGALQTAASGIETLVTVTPRDHLQARSQSAIGIFDVLEHIESESEFLAMINELLCPSGVLVVTVPTGNWLFSQTDLALGHHRRYSRKKLRIVMESAGFEEVYSKYIFLFLVPFAFVFRTLPFRFRVCQSNNQQLKRVGDSLGSKSLPTRILGFASRLEAHLDRFGVLPYGLSIVAVYRPTRRTAELEL